jgi:hypothetical protein
VEQQNQQQQSSSLLNQQRGALGKTVETVLARIEHDEREQQIELLI